jgi:type II secretory pathway pseudopilin PulG
VFNFLNNTKEKNTDLEQNLGSVRSGQRGQTLIETVVAIFILVMGISSAISLAVYSFKNEDDAGKVVIATGLAREGIESVKNLRDQSWLSNTPVSDCSFSSGLVDYCIPDWLSAISPGYTLDSNKGTRSYALKVNPLVTSNIYSLDSSAASYALSYCNGTTYIESGSYICSPTQTTSYYRMLTLTVADTDPVSGSSYSFTEGGKAYAGLLDIVSTVWWTSRSCPQTNNPSTLPVSCKIVLETYLTNWQNR